MPSSLRPDLAAPTVAPLEPSTRLLLGPGPSSVHPRVLRAMATPLLGYLDPEFLTLLDETQALLRHVFQTQNAWTLPVSGTGMAGMETLLANLLRVPSIVFAVNKLDAVEDPHVAFTNIRAALLAFTEAARIEARGIIPISALKGHNVVEAQPGWCGYEGLSLLQWLEQLDVTPPETDEAFSFPVQWVEKFSSSSDTSQGRRVFWG